MIGSEEIENRFGFHKGTIEGPNATAPRHAELRRLFVDLGNFLDEQIRDGRAKSTAFTHLQDASMWFHFAIAEDAPVVEESIAPSSDLAELKKTLKILHDIDANLSHEPGATWDETVSAHRNALVWQAFELAKILGYTIGVGPDVSTPGWVVLYIDLPEVGQVSWHVPAGPDWDGHDRKTKQQRLDDFVRGIWTPKSINLPG